MDERFDETDARKWWGWWGYDATGMAGFYPRAKAVIIGSIMSAAAVSNRTGSLTPSLPRDIMIAGEPMVHVPAWVVDLDSFRRWSLTSEFPERGRIEYFQGTVWVDMTMEEIYGHNQIKQLLNLVLGGLVERDDLGRYFPDGARLVNEETNLACEPDAMFASWQTLQSGQLHDSPGSDVGVVELIGAPDLAVEVVSKSSTQRDNTRRRSAFWQAGIHEYWIIDVRQDQVSFDVLHHTANGYMITPASDGWVHSDTFGKEFRLSRTVDRLGKPKYQLESR